MICYYCWCWSLEMAKNNKNKLFFLNKNAFLSIRESSIFYKPLYRNFPKFFVWKERDGFFIERISRNVSENIPLNKMKILPNVELPLMGHSKGHCHCVGNVALMMKLIHMVLFYWELVYIESITFSYFISNLFFEPFCNNGKIKLLWYENQSVYICIVIL